MTGINDGDAVHDDQEEAKARENESSFVWDEESKLYYHASSGFYHDPNAGWYYSSRDGHYYKFENGTYVPLAFDKDEESEPYGSTYHLCGEPVEEKTCNEEVFASDGLDDHRPPSEWLEETLINIYLSGNSGMDLDTGNPTMTLQNNEGELSLTTCEGSADQLDLDKLPAYHQIDTVEENRLHEDMHDTEISTDLCSERDALLQEEQWQAQYGQVVRAAYEGVPKFPVSDLWDWKLVQETVKKRKQVARLSGRLVRPSSKLHPSAPARGGLLKTASICHVHLDLVHVASGKVYRLRTPNKRYLDALSAYDSSNPTKDWGFPDLFVNMDNIESLGSDEAGVTHIGQKLSPMPDVPTAFPKHTHVPYRDRAAERRTLHGEFSFGPGQKKSSGVNLYEEGSSSQTYDPEVAAVEAMDMTFGKGSYARRVLEKMGWKDGEALGSTSKGILEPLQAVANKGYAGLGWNHAR